MVFILVLIEVLCIVLLFQVAELRDRIKKLERNTGLIKELLEEKNVHS